MLRLIVNALLAVFLVSATMSDGWLPCIEDCADDVSGSASRCHAADDDRGRSAPESCEHCACCQYSVNTLPFAFESSALVTFVAGNARPPAAQIPPSPPVDTIDHVPLA